LFADTSDQLDWLLLREPKYLATYPSNLQALLKESEQTGDIPTSIDKIVLSSEPVSPQLVGLAKRLWGATCVPTYSANEVGLLACQIPDGQGYYVQADNAFVEVLDDDDRPCAPGEVGRVVVTTLFDLRRPLIRYEIGDYAEVDSTDPNDPISLPRLKRIVGRQRTMIRLPNGRRVWPHFEFASLVEMGGMRAWQLVQRKDLSMLVRVVPTERYSEAVHDEIVHTVKVALPGLAVKVVEVGAIARTPRGKFRELISELEDD
jgi:phenylacetate-CoA ligase